MDKRSRGRGIGGGGAAQAALGGGGAMLRSPASPADAGLAMYSPVSALMARASSGLRIGVVGLQRQDSRGEDIDFLSGSSPSTPGFVVPPAFPSSEPRPCPPTPLRPRHRIGRQDSLRETKLLIASPLLAATPPGAFDGENAFEFVQLIGSSRTSEVWLARSTADGSLSAVKRSLAAFTGRADRSRMLHEVQAAQALPDHPCVVRYMRGWQHEGHLYLQTELCEGGSLAAVLQALPAGSLLPEGDVWKLAAELGDGLAHCHAHGVTHLDVKPSNVFLDAHAAAKLGDFGLALLAGRGWGVEEGDGAYCAPELLAADPLPGPHSDVYSLGATLVEAACGAPPPRGGRAGPLVLPGARSPQLVATLEACLHPDPHQRPSAEDVCLEACRVLGRPRHRGTS